MITACDAMTVAAVASSTIGIRAHSGVSRKNGALTVDFVGKHQRTLTEIAQRARRKHEPEPAVRDGLPAEVTHVGI